MKRIYTLVLLILCTLKLSAQEATGVITDENNKAMFGVNVVEKNTYNGTTTDFDGKFNLKLTTENPVLILSYIGYLDKENSLRWKTTQSSNGGRCHRCRCSNYICF